MIVCFSVASTFFENSKCIKHKEINDDDFFNMELKLLKCLNFRIYYPNNFTDEYDMMHGYDRDENMCDILLSL